MGIIDQLTRAGVDPNNPRSVSGRARAKRWDRLLATFPDLVDMDVLDLGGTSDFWRAAPVRPRSVLTVNLATDAPDESWIRHQQADACTLPPTVGRFDVVISNSLLEHVGGHARRQDLAAVVHGAGDRHWIQTPYRYFPVEPHWMMPGMQFLPFAARVRAAQAWPLGNRPRQSRAAALDSVGEVELVGITQMRTYFPRSEIWVERLAGLPKSLVAVAS